MVFSSLLFLVVFLPTFLVVYYATGVIDHCLSRLTNRAPRVTFRNYVVLVGSYFFYAWDRRGLSSCSWSPARWTTG
jgi:hypothetical protein